MQNGIAASVKAWHIIRCSTNLSYFQHKTGRYSLSLLRIVIAVSVQNRFLPGQHIHLPSAQSNSHHEPLSWQEIERLTRWLGIVFCVCLMKAKISSVISCEPVKRKAPRRRMVMSLVSTQSRKQKGIPPRCQKEWCPMPDLWDPSRRLVIICWRGLSAITWKMGGRTNLANGLKESSIGPPIRKVKVFFAKAHQQAFCLL